MSIEEQIQDAVTRAIRSERAAIVADVTRAISAVVGERMLTTAEAAALMQVSEWHVRMLVKDGKLPAKRLGRNVRIPASACSVPTDDAVEAPIRAARARRGR